MAIKSYAWLFVENLRYKIHIVNTDIMHYKCQYDIGNQYLKKFK